MIHLTSHRGLTRMDLVNVLAGMARTFTTIREPVCYLARADAWAYRLLVELRMKGWPDDLETWTHTVRSTSEVNHASR